MAEFFDAKTFNGEVFGKYVDVIPRLTLNEMLRSGALRTRAEWLALFNEQTGAWFLTLPMYGRLESTPVNYDGETDIVPTSTSTYSRGVVAYGRADAWKEKDFSYDITSGVDFVAHIRRLIVEHWEDVDQLTLYSILKGIFSMTSAANTEFVEKHTYDITGNTSDAALVGPTTLNTAIQQASGDAKGRYSLVLMHSAVATHLENLNCLEYLKQTDAHGIQRDLTLATWNGRSVIIDDGLPCDETEGTYTTYVLGKGAIDYANVGAKVPYSMFREELKNGGETILVSRQRKIFAPFGIGFTKSSVAKFSPTNAELEMGANWGLVKGTNNRVINHRAIPIARIISRAAPAAATP